MLCIECQYEGCPDRQSAGLGIFEFGWKKSGAASANGRTLFPEIPG
jgi:hypothetical protein